MPFPTSGINDMVITGALATYHENNPLLRVASGYTQYATSGATSGYLELYSEKTSPTGLGSIMLSGYGA